MTDLHLIEYKVTVLADDETQTLAIYAANKREAAKNALKLASRLLGTRVARVKRVAEAKYKPLV